MEFGGAVVSYCKAGQWARLETVGCALDLLKAVHAPNLWNLALLEQVNHQVEEGLLIKEVGVTL